MDWQRLFKKCEEKGEDPTRLLKRMADELHKLNAERRDWMLAVLADHLTAPTPPRRTPDRAKMQGEGEEDEAYFPCRWCNDQNVWGEDWHGWLHWFICGWPGYGCTEFPEPPPE